MEIGKSNAFHVPRWTMAAGGSTASRLASRRPKPGPRTRKAGRTATSTASRTWRRPPRRWAAGRPGPRRVRVQERRPRPRRPPRPSGRRSTLPERYLSRINRKARLKAHKDGRLVMQIIKKPGEKDKSLEGWISKNDKWVKIFDVLADTKRDDVSHAEYDNIIRQLVSPTGEDAGWYLARRRRDVAALRHREGQAAAASRWATRSPRWN